MKSLQKILAEDEIHSSDMTSLGALMLLGESLVSHDNFTYTGSCNKTVKITILKKFW